MQCLVVFDNKKDNEGEMSSISSLPLVRMLIVSMYFTSRVMLLKFRFIYLVKCKSSWNAFILSLMCIFGNDFDKDG
jgi:hypothetical protein